MKKILLFFLLCVFGVVIFLLLPTKNTKKFNINSSKGGQLIRLDTDGHADDLYSSVRIRLKGELSENSEIFLSRSDNLLLERDIFLRNRMMKLTFISIKLLNHSLPINSLSAINNLSSKSMIMSALRIKLIRSLSESTPLCSYTLK